MKEVICGVLLALLVIFGRANADDVHTLPPSKIFDSLKGCWQGTGSVLGKPVGTVLRIEPILLGAMFAIDVDSSAIASSSDRYKAHLLFGSGASAANAVWGFWSDSFGASFTATGNGAASNDGFDVTYHYPDTNYVNRWRVQNDRLSWTIVSKAANAEEKPFAAYELARVKCSAP